ncbi:hypothetical protein GCM10011391_38950 [Pullulanibacillus camelliae]|uniref:O-antigen ligase-related domain-containing protein n=1 Tax=Pullulanibacillus camelliae TaxID=1707096 RepID=A0A8J2YN06_9BACL|nr:O-antigen ligase family protein [Pullulanibacillus camelliae]GGE56164.1 hypothetical protein GCM10011391_38950 [Pullulanibacillus camelliae]
MEFNGFIKVLLGGGVLFFILSLIFPIAALAVVTTLLFMGLAFLKPKIGLVILTVYIPIRPLLITLNPALKIMGDAIIILIFIKVAYEKIRSHAFKTFCHLSVFEWAFLAFIAVGVIAALITGVSLGSIVFEIRAFLLMFLVYYAVKHLETIHHKDKLVFLWVSFSIAMLICIHGFIERLSLRRWLLPEVWKTQTLAAINQFRIYGLPNNPNVLAMYLAMSFILALFLWHFYWRGWSRLIPFIGMVLIAGVFILTYSRGTMIAFGVTFIAYLLISKKVKVIIPIAAALLCSFIFFVLPIGLSGQSHHAKLMEQNEEADAHSRMAETFDKQTLQQSWNSGRLYVVKEGFRIFKDSPIIGTGFGTYGDSAATAYGSPLYKTYHLNPNLYADNQYIQIIVQTGIAGVIFFAVYLLGLLTKLWKQRKKTQMSVVVLSLLLGVYIAGLYYNIWENKIFTFYFFILLGYVGYLNQKERQHEDTSSHRG